MAGNKYIYNNVGTLTEKASTQTSAGASSAGEIPALDATGHLDPSLLPVGMGSETDEIIASEDLSAGSFVNIWTSSGMAKVRRADGSVAGKEANGFVMAAVAPGAIATVYRPTQTNTQLTGLVPGICYFLSDVVPGGVVPVPPVGAGKTVQNLGRAKSTTELIFEQGTPIVLA